MNYEISHQFGAIFYFGEMVQVLILPQYRGGHCGPTDLTEFVLKYIKVKKKRRFYGIGFWMVMTILVKKTMWISWNFFMKRAKCVFWKIKV